MLAKPKLRFAGRGPAGRLIASTVVGQGVDTALVLTLAFAGAVPAADLLRLGLSAWVLTVGREVVALPLSLPSIADLDPFRPGA